MKRRDFITLLGGAASWALAARAQQGERMRRIGWLWGGGEDDLGLQVDRTALQEALAKVGWIEGRNLRIEIRFGAGDTARLQGYAAELVRLAPDVMLASNGAAASAVQSETRTIPIVFTAGPDPVAAGLVRNI